MSEELLLNLLAVIHRDGGHYVEQHGIEKAAEDAMQLSSDRLALIDHLEADGMVLVPREPTEAMLAATWDAEIDGLSWLDECRAVWTAMLSALPVLGVGR